MLDATEKSRYSRHILLDEVGELGQQKLKNTRVLVIGCGGLGCPALQYLAAAGVGHLGIIDDDRVDFSNLQRQILFAEKHVGMLKVEAAKEALHRLNSQIIIKIYPTRLSADNALELLNDYDIIVEGSDSFSTKYLANDAAVLSGKPLVFGSIFKFEGQVSVFNFKNGPTYRCLYPEPVNETEMPTCSEVGVLGILPGIIGMFQANEVIKIILGLGNILSGKLLIYNSLDVSQMLLPFNKNDSIEISELIELDLSCSINSANEIDYKYFKENESAYVLIDVRSKTEREASNIGGLHIPLDQLLKNPNQIAEYGEVVFYCESGKRSAKAVDQLQKRFSEQKMHSLKGGIAEALLLEN
ncbi:molybdopterin-synthase adenylyltransferase MoeB [Leeuwenhoekiella sp. LLG6367-2.1]|uniref:molybdopterin-synthase adenylyltransferase MoeB n=1 Tax=Leeuwenhoekiella sp. LLG6367-2.1 TaxID=3160833 RepID=UPI0038690405